MIKESSSYNYLEERCHKTVGWGSRIMFLLIPCCTASIIKRVGLIHIDPEQGLFSPGPSSAHDKPWPCVLGWWLAAPMVKCLLIHLSKPWQRTVYPILIMHVDVSIDVKTELYINAPGQGIRYDVMLGGPYTFGHELFIYLSSLTSKDPLPICSIRAERCYRGGSLR